MFAAEQADELVVGLLDKTSSIGAYFSNEERFQALNSLKFIKHIIIIENNLEKVISQIKPDVVVKGQEFKNQFNPEQESIKAFGGKLIFSSGEKQFSSKELLRRQLTENSDLSMQLQKYHERYDISLNTLQQITDRFCNKRIAVFGDIIIDEYQECLPIGMSQEDPSIAVSPLGSYRYLGGAGIVAGHATSLGASAELFSVSGNDELREFAVEMLNSQSTTGHILIDNTRPTTHKLRYRAKDKTLLRVNNFRKHDIEEQISTDLFDIFAAKVKDFDLVIFADFNYGILTKELVEKVSLLCSKNGVPIIADSQTSSQIGDLSKYRDIALTSPTEIEARITTQDETNGLIQVSTDLAQLLNADNVIVTLGPEGILIRSRSDHGWDTDRLPALSNSAVDTAGAGDALFVTAGLSLISDATAWQAAFLGSVSASIQVNVRGNIPIKKEVLIDNLHRYVK
ncbi:MAG: PfkB family carbohydrate kinase [Aestuariibacter sp.]